MIIGSIIGVVVLINIIIIGYICYKQVFYNDNKNKDVYNIPIDLTTDKEKNKVRNLIDELASRPYEKVSIQAFDNIKINARYYHVNDNAPIEIVFHGYKSNCVSDFCGGNKIATALGHNVLLVEQRGHGESETNTICFGIKEKRDCVSWIEYVLNRFGANIKIILIGISMGASTVLMASDQKLPSNVKGIIADSPFTSPKDIILKVSKSRNIPLIFAKIFISIGGFLFAHINFNAPGAKDAVKNTNIPVLLIHGDADDFVPCEMSKIIYDNCNSEKEFYTFPGATHANSFIVDEKRYIGIIEQFINKILK